MFCRLNILLAVMVALITLAGCYTTPVRHLSADVALLKVGQSTEEDVLVFLGDPDERQELVGGVEKWLYHEKKMTIFEKTPWMGKYLGAPEYQEVVVTITNKIVSDVSYASSDADDLDWDDDFSWQKKKE
jgi:hypothetical protein